MRHGDHSTRDTTHDTDAHNGRHPDTDLTEQTAAEHDDVEAELTDAAHQHVDHVNEDEHAGHNMHAGHGGHEGHGGHAAAFQRLFWISLVLSVPVLLYSEMLQEWLNFSMPEFTGSDWIAPVLGTVVFVVGGRVILEGGAQELRNRQPGMMALISLAISVAFITSLPPPSMCSISSSGGSWCC